MAAPLRLTCAGRLFRSNVSLHLCQNGCMSHQILLVSSKHRVAGSEKDSDDFFGFTEHSLQEHIDPLDDTVNREAQKKKLLNSLTRKKRNTEVVVQSKFGQVRLDANAKRNSFRDLDINQFLQSVNPESSSSSSTSGSGSGTETGRMNGDTSGKVQNMKSSGRDKKTKKERGKGVSDQVNRPNQHTSNYFDEQYFGEIPHGEPVAMERTVQNMPHTVEMVERWSEDVRSAPASEHSVSHHDPYVASQPLLNTNDGHEDSFIDEVYFPNLTQSSRHSSPSSDSDQKSGGVDQNASSFIDEQYFSNHLEENTGHTSFAQRSQTPENVCQEEYSWQDNLSDNSMKSSSVQAGMSREPSENLGFVDGQYFDGNDKSYSTLDGTMNQYGITAESTPGGSLKQHSIDNETETERFSRPSSGNRVIHDSHSQSQSQSQSNAVQRQQALPESDVNAIQQLHDKQFKEPGQSQSQNTRGMEKPNAAAKVDDSAYDVAMKMRRNLRLNIDSDKTAGEVPRDKKRVLALKEQVPDLRAMPALEVASLLADNIIFENDDFIAINKPYGLPSHGGPGVRVSVGQVLEPLSRRLDRGRSPQHSLHLVHRLDKETTGAMLLAKNAEVAWQLLGMFRRREVGKTYWTVTKGLPQPHEGVIDIPLARQKVGAIYKTVVKPKEYVSEGKFKTQKWSRRGDASAAAMTEYRVLAKRDSMALVECRPLTGVQHQIRAHLAQALNTPVLGDHKYSHMDRLAPQKLFPEALQKLGIWQAQVRHVPMHLHAKGLLLPEWRGRSNIFIKASIPRHFLHNLKALKIKIPPK